MSEYVKIAISLVIKILQNNDNPTNEGLHEIFEIQRGNKKIIIEHIKAIRDIMEEELGKQRGHHYLCESWVVVSFLLVINLHIKKAMLKYNYEKMEV